VNQVVQGTLHSVAELVDDLHEGRDGGGPALVDLLKDLAIPAAFFVAIDNLVALRENLK
jgi:hypothetical protein